MNYTLGRIIGKSTLKGEKYSIWSIYDTETNKTVDYCAAVVFDSVFEKNQNMSFDENMEFSKKIASMYVDIRNLNNYSFIDEVGRDLEKVVISKIKEAVQAGYLKVISEM